MLFTISLRDPKSQPPKKEEERTVTIEIKQIKVKRQ
jgi:hypothetical protein